MASIVFICPLCDTPIVYTHPLGEDSTEYKGCSVPSDLAYFLAKQHVKCKGCKEVFLMIIKPATVSIGLVNYGVRQEGGKYD